MGFPACPQEWPPVLLADCQCYKKDTWTERCGKRPHLYAGQIIATSHDRFPPNGGLARENLGWWNIIIWPDLYAGKHLPCCCTSCTTSCGIQQNCETAVMGSKKLNTYEVLELIWSHTWDIVFKQKSPRPIKQILIYLKMLGYGRLL